jgi:glycosyltransferase involved in cell wall biosynthesis
MSAELRDKCIFLPENAIDPTRFSLKAKPPRAPGPLRVAFVGRLVALKGVDMLIEAAAPLMQSGQLTLDIIGDGPERPRLQAMLEAGQMQSTASLEGWVEHAQLQTRLQQSDLLALPSIREFGGGVVLEAMALGLPPIVLDHGGPPELVPTDGGYVLPLENRNQVVADLRQLLTKLSTNPNALATKGQAAQAHVQQYFTWPIKARQIHEVYEWVLGKRTEKPTWGVPFGELSNADQRDTHSSPFALAL